jgi:hypothetical protein
MAASDPRIDVDGGISLIGGDAVSIERLVALMVGRVGEDDRGQNRGALLWTPTIGSYRVVEIETINEKDDLLEN